jgi:hypothetical protein
MNYVIEVGSNAIIYIPSSIKFGGGIQKLIGGYTRTYRMQIAYACLHLMK